MSSRDRRPAGLQLRLVALAILFASARVEAQTPLTPPQLLSDGQVAVGGLACSDGVDNDADGVADYPGDAGCSSPSSLRRHPRL